MKKIAKIAGFVVAGAVVGFGVAALTSAGPSAKRFLLGPTA